MKRHRIQISEDGFMHCPGCGLVLDDERSQPYDGAFHAFLTFVCAHWPDTYTEFKPDNKEHLRAWVLVQAKHIVPSDTFTVSTPLELEIATRVLTWQAEQYREIGQYGWPAEVAPGQLRFQRPASIKWAKVTHSKFSPLTSKVFQIIFDITGIDFNDWIKSGRRKPDRKAA
jgi:hypothetical protein